MDRADIDVAALRDFIGTLQGFNGNLNDSFSQLKSRWGTASDSWRDVKKDQFAGAVGWDEVIHMMEGYLSKSDDYLNFLKKLEQNATNYLES